MKDGLLGRMFNGSGRRKIAFKTFQTTNAIESLIKKACNCKTHLLVTLRRLHNERKWMAVEDDEASAQSECVAILGTDPDSDSELGFWARTETSLGLGGSLNKARFIEVRWKRRGTKRFRGWEQREGEEREEGFAAIVVCVEWERGRERTEKCWVFVEVVSKFWREGAFGGRKPRVKDERKGGQWVSWLLIRRDQKMWWEILWKLVQCL